MPLAAIFSELGEYSSLVLEVDQVLPQFVFGDLIGRLVEVGGELPDGAEVSLLRPLGEAGQLEVLVHALAKRDAHEWVLSKRREEKPSGNHSGVATVLCHRSQALWRSCAESQGGLGERPEIILPRSGLLELKTRSDLAKPSTPRSPPTSEGQDNLAPPTNNRMLNADSLSRPPVKVGRRRGADQCPPWRCPGTAVEA